ncbi:ABC transporter ATP-binding protein [Georgenia sp. 10Sc9-8]|uniref:ABC transporter ATP-binding protein n=1 Tax=Georgenia halotolerans TaxID=3028317 RepID=A0ABT5U1B5_9MICO|nr:ABC transporter ATP-binding protein [Georgenia halotolerans]
MSLLDVSGLSAGYGKISVLHEVGLTVDDREIVAVVGPNGAGKSTLVQAIMQLLKDASGSVVVNATECGGRRTSELSRLGVGYVPQGGNTFPDLSIEENLRVAVRGSASVAAERGLRRAYERFPVLGERRHQSASTLSGGERQMLAVAAAMAIEPYLLILDEPTTGLAPTIVQSLSESIRAYRDGGAGILWVVEENPLQILKHSDRVYLMQGGVMRRETSAAAMLADEGLRELFFGLDHTA